MKDLLNINSAFTVSKEELEQSQLEIYKSLKKYNIEKYYTIDKFKELSSSDRLKIVNYFKMRQDCIDCTNPRICKQIPRGTYPKIRKVKSGFEQLEIISVECEKYKNIKEDITVNKTGEVKFTSKLIEEHGDTNTRIKLFSYLNDFTSNWSQNKFVKGAYIYGPSQVGKTYIMKSFMNFLSEKYNSEYVYYPDLSRKVKALTYSYDKLEQIVQKYKNVDILLLDGIGNEALDENVRDEFLGSILNSRLQNQKPTFFCSNYKYDELKEHFTLGNAKRSGKSERIVKQIEQMTTFIHLK